MNKENEKFLDKINNALLSAGKCAEDIVTPKMKGETPRETMVRSKYHMLTYYTTWS